MKRYNDAMSIFKRAEDAYTRLTGKYPKESELALCSTLLCLTECYGNLLKKAPQKPYRKQALSTLDRALELLKKYPGNPTANTYLAAAQYWQGHFGKK